MNVKETFVSLFDRNVTREGKQDILKFLDDNNFYECPASTKYHGNYKGGLAEHSINVYYALIDVLKLIYGDRWSVKYSYETITIVSLLHDLCKIDKYVEGTRNVKNEFGQWEQVNCFEYAKDQVRLGHASASIYMIQDYMKLTTEERQAIHWHMGAFDISPYNSTYDLGHAFEHNTLAFALHMADMLATYVDENEDFVPIPVVETVESDI